MRTSLKRAHTVTPGMHRDRMDPKKIQPPRPVPCVRMGSAYVGHSHCDPKALQLDQ